MRNSLLVVAGACLLAGCMSVPKAEGYLVRKGALPGICAAAFPSDTLGFTPGVLGSIHDTTEVPGPSIPCPPAKTDTVTGKQEVVYVKCPPTRTIHDSTFIHDTLLVVPTGVKAELAALKQTTDSLNTALKKETVRADKYHDWYLADIFILIGLGLAGAGLLFFTVKKKISI